NMSPFGDAIQHSVGGLITGAALFIVMRPAGVKLFDYAHSEPVLAAAKFKPLGVMRSIVYIAAVITAIVAIVAIATLASLTMPPVQWSTCAGYPGVDQDTRIRGCSALIRSSGERARDRAFAYHNRGGAWLTKGDNGRAIADTARRSGLIPKTP